MDADPPWDVDDEPEAAAPERDDLTIALFDEPAPAPATHPPSAPAHAPTTDAGAYRVLARKYRPNTFEDLIGQEAMVRTLRNAFASGRIAHAFMLTGVRGVGKTTTRPSTSPSRG